MYYRIDNQLSNSFMWKFIFFFMNNSVNFYSHTQIIQNKLISFVNLFTKRTFVFFLIKKINTLSSTKSGTLNSGSIIMLTQKNCISICGSIFFIADYKIQVLQIFSCNLPLCTLRKILAKIFYILVFNLHTRTGKFIIINMAATVRKFFQSSPVCVAGCRSKTYKSTVCCSKRFYKIRSCVSWKHIYNQKLRVAYHLGCNVEHNLRIAHLTNCICNIIL